MTKILLLVLSAALLTCLVHAGGILPTIKQQKFQHPTPPSPSHNNHHDSHGHHSSSEEKRHSSHHRHITTKSPLPLTNNLISTNSTLHLTTTPHNNATTTIPVHHLIQSLLDLIYDDDAKPTQVATTTTSIASPQESALQHLLRLLHLKEISRRDAITMPGTTTKTIPHSQAQHNATQAHHNSTKKAATTIHYNLHYDQDYALSDYEQEFFNKSTTKKLPKPAQLNIGSTKKLNVTTPATTTTKRNHNATNTSKSNMQRMPDPVKNDTSLLRKSRRYAPTPGVIFFGVLFGLVAIGIIVTITLHVARHSRGKQQVEYTQFDVDERHSGGDIHSYHEYRDFGRQ